METSKSTTAELAERRFGFRLVKAENGPTILGLVRRSRLLRDSLDVHRVGTLLLLGLLRRRMGGVTVRGLGLADDMRILLVAALGSLGHMWLRLLEP